jgi:hypothetical protein
MEFLGRILMVGAIASRGCGAGISDARPGLSTIRLWVVPDRHRAMPIVEIEVWLTDRTTPELQLHHDRAGP